MPQTTSKTDAEDGPTDQAVLNYLRKKGLGSAALELTKILKEHEGDHPESKREKMEMAEAEARTQRSLLSRSGSYGTDADSAAQIPQWGIPDKYKTNEAGESDTMGVEEAKVYVDSYTAFQTWVLSLPDDPSMPTKTNKTAVTLGSIAKKLAGEDSLVPDNVLNEAEALDPAASSITIPPSSKPELLAVSFALLVHTYCELLEVGMESTAHTILSSFRPVFEPLYNKELQDLDTCNTMDDAMRLTSNNSQHVDSLARLKAIMIQVANIQLKKDELNSDLQKNPNSSSAASKRRKLTEYDSHTLLLQQKYQEVAKNATVAFDKMRDLPFLRRARAVRWQLTLSATSYAMLAAFLSSRESLLPMSTLLQTRCEIHVERRDPLPYTPACLLEDFVVTSRTRHKNRNETEVNWAAPVPLGIRAALSGQDASEMQKLPFPPMHIEEEYDSVREAAKAKHGVNFNRAVLAYGFRRLEALERKREYDAGIRCTTDEKEEEDRVDPALANALEPSILMSTLCASSSSGPRQAALSSRFGPSSASSIWQETGIGISCARLCPPDGRRVAAGCDDASIRIWSIFDQNKDSEEKEDVQETAMVLLGHKNGFPVFDVDWNRDGRHLLSAGGDGSVRLWDTMAVGPYGSVAKVTTRSAQLPSEDDKEELVEESGMSVPGLKAESNQPKSGAALAVYRGHAPSCPVWSVSFAPSGYYFASTAADATARIWTTDRPAPVRLLSGHASASVNCIKWHPNCNYVITGSDDKTVRMWDVQSGRCVRLMNGSGEGINVVAVCPTGRYCAGADFGGTIHLWDLGNGRKINEFQSAAGMKRYHGGAPVASMIHALSYSACGSALAAGGDDCQVRIWDVRGAANHLSNPDIAMQQGWGEGGPLPNSVAMQLYNRPGTKKPHHSYPTGCTMLLDLQYTKRNLLLAVGKYTTPVPLAVIQD